MNTRKRRVEWSSLPNELLTTIGERLECHSDVLRFVAVCTSWRSSIILPRRTSPMKLPYPIVPNGVAYKGPVHFTLTESTVYRFEPLRDEGSNNSNDCDGGGWLMKVEEWKPGKFRLLNPLCQQEIRYSPKMFPKKLNLFDYRVFELCKAYRLEYVSRNHPRLGVDKAIYSADDSALLVIHQEGKLALLRLKDEKWTQLGESWDIYRDIMLYKGQFHAIGRCGKLVVINSSTLKITEVARPLYASGSMKHLLQRSGDIYMVDRYLQMDQHLFHDYCPTQTADFKIYKLNEAERDWIKVKSLVDQAIFLGDDCSFLSSVKKIAGSKENRIYFNDKYVRYYLMKEEDDVLIGLNYRSNALFNLKDRSISGLVYDPGNLQVVWPPPTWLKSN